MMNRQPLQLIAVGMLCALPLMQDIGAEAKTTMQHLRTFTDSEEPEWRAQNDGVMGGVSSGGARITEGTLHFEGVLSLENNGGFAQIYSPVKHRDYSGHAALRLRVLGDGRTYQFRLSTDASFRGSRIAYRASFPTKAGEWAEIRLPFDAFVPSFRGRTLNGPPLDLSSVTRIALLLADGKPGEFALTVDWIALEAPSPVS